MLAFGQSKIFSQSIRLLSARDKKKYFLIALTQVALSILDLIGVASIGALGALSVSGVQSKPAGDRVQSLLDLLHLSDLDFQHQVAVLGILSSVILITRTVLSILFSRRSLFFLSKKSAEITNQLVRKVLSQPLTAIQNQSAQETLYGLTYGVHSILVGILANVLILCSDVSLLIVLFSGLLVLDPMIALFAILVFGCIGVSIHLLLSKRSVELGNLQSRLEIQSNAKILQALTTYREIVVRNKQNKISNEIAELRVRLAGSQAETAFMPNISKYTIETTVVLGALLIGGTQFLLQDAVHAVATLTVFLAAGSRIAPAVLRIQYGALSFKTSIGASKVTFELISKTKEIQVDFEDDSENEGPGDFVGKVELKEVDFAYADSKKLTIRNANLVIEAGSFTAIVGPSGAGKTTLVDLILGLISPLRGQILISDLPPREVFRRWPERVSYVPQDISTLNASIKENVGFGFNAQEILDVNVWAALEAAQLRDFVTTLSDDINTHVGDNGVRMSGGQRQRLGIARALYTNPKLLILDEATSALDGETEAAFSESIHKLKGSVTLVMIAHRLSTIQQADKIIYLEGGEILAQGTFDEVRKLVSKFDTQAHLLGL
jgi:ATP-binding cassette, subfamily B, bacterial PglK